MTEEEFAALKAADNITRVSIVPGLCLVICSGKFAVKAVDADGIVKFKVISVVGDVELDSYFKLINKFTDEELRLLDETSLAQHVITRLKETLSDNDTVPIEIMGITFNSVLGFSNTYHPAVQQ